MNHTYRKIWSQRVGGWVVVSEITAACGKSTGTVAAAGLATLLSIGTALAQTSPPVLPSGAQVTAGQAAVTNRGASLTVTQSTSRAAINWQSFSIGQGGTVQFVQPDSSSIILNRVVGNEGSVIDGALQANGHVFLVNPNGVLFGTNARVDVGGLVASTRNLSDADLMAGKTQFIGSGASDVVNHGHIVAADGGYVALIGRAVRNDGSITAKLGSVVAAAGDKVSLNFNGDSLVGVTIDRGTLQALVDNGGAIRADGGQILLSAKTASALVDAVVNNTGELRAQTVAHEHGRILLLADMEHGQAHVGGTLDASAPVQGDGGFIETSASKVQVQDGTRVSTASASGKAGTWLLDPTDFTVSSGTGALVTSGIGATTLQSALSGGNVTLQTDAAGSQNGDININAPVAWSANTLTLNAAGKVNVNQTMSGTGSASLSVLYGQGALQSGNTSRFVVASGAKVDLPDGNNLTLTFGSDGTPTTYYVISSLGAQGSTTGTDLQGIDSASYINGNYALGADIDASATSSWNLATGFHPIGTGLGGFGGSFEGLGHTVSNLFIYRTTTQNVGLFSSSSGNSRFANLNLTNVNITSDSQTGALVGQVASGTVLDNIHTSGTVFAADYTGGVVGKATGTGIVFESLSSTATVVGVHDVGGIAGLSQAVVSNITASGNVSATEGASGAGGVIGEFTGSAIANASASGNVTGVGNVGGLIGLWNANTNATGLSASGNVTSTGNGAGGVVGSMGTNRSAIFTNFTASGSVTGTNNVGGLVGSADTINGGAATGVVTGSGSAAGGIAGSAFGISNVSHAAAVNGVDRVGGVVGVLVEGSALNVASTSTVTGTGSEVGGVVGEVNATSGGVATANGGGAVSGVNKVGGVIGNVVAGTVDDVHGTGNVVGSGTQVGGAIGVDTISAITNSTATGTVSGAGYVGGLAGQAGAIGSSQASGAVTSSGAYAGGLAGQAGAVTSSSASGNILGTQYVGGAVGRATSLNTVSALGTVTGSGSYVGGAAGKVDSSITGGSAQGAVSGAGYTGGYVGIAGGAVSGTTASGNVTGTGQYVGGAAGKASSLTSVSASGSVTSSSSYVGGVAGRVDGSVTGGTAQGSVAGTSYTGGYAGSVGGSVSGSGASGAVTGNGSYVGGLIGSGANINSSSASGNVAQTGVGSAYAGGLVGLAATVSNSTESGSVSGGTLVGGIAGKATSLSSDTATGANVSGTSDFVGGVAGNVLGDSSNISASGSVSGARFVGGAIGLVSGQFTRRGRYISGAVTNASATGQVTATGDFAGGLIGETTGGSVSSSNASGNVSSQGGWVGGLIGEISTASGSIFTSWASGNVTAVGSSVGGLVGYLDQNSNITSSHATGNVTGHDWVGGLVGSAGVGTIDTTFATGNVTGNANVGGLVGYLTNGLNNSYSSGNVTGNLMVGGLMGDHYVTAGPTNSFYDADAVVVTVNGVNQSAQITPGGIYHSQYADWVAGNYVPLSAANYLTADANGNFQLGNVQDLKNMLAFLTDGSSFKVTANIDLTPIPGWHIPVMWGDLDGGFHVLSNLQNLQQWNNFQGLIGSSWGNVQRLGVTGTVQGFSVVGGLVGDNEGAISQSFAKVAVSGNAYVGGLVGDNNYYNTPTATITDSYSTGSVTAVVVTTDPANAVQPYAVGALVGENDSTITRSYSDSRVTCAVTGCDAWGGLVGAHFGSEVGSFAVQDFTGANTTSGINSEVAPGEDFISASGASAAGTFVSANWDVASIGASSSVWRIYEGQTMPMLRGFLQPLTVSASSGGTSRQYDGTTAFGNAVSYSSTPDANHVLGTVQVNTSSPNAGAQMATPSGLYSDQTGYDITYASASVTIDPRQLTYTGGQIATRVYDGTNGATLIPGIVSGFVGSETLGLSSSASLDTANAGNRSATVSFTLADGGNGGLAANYELPSQMLPALVTPKVLTVVGTTASGKTYDGTTAANVNAGTLVGLVGSETLDVSATGIYDSRNAGSRNVTAHYGLANGINGGLADNYVLADTTGLSATITPRTLNVGFTVTPKTYDSTTVASASISDNRISGDQLTFNFTANFVDANAGYGKSVDIGGFNVSGADASNYKPVLLPATGDINKRLVDFTLNRAGSQVWVADGKVLFSAGDLPSLFSSAWLNSLPNVSPGSLSFTLWKNGVQVTDASLPGMYEVRASFVPADGNYAALPHAVWPVLQITDGGQADVAAEALRTGISGPQPYVGDSQQRNLALQGSNPPNVVNTPPQLASNFGEGVALHLVGAPSGNEPTQSVGLREASVMLGAGGAAGTDVRVPLGRNSLVTLVNGGVRLPEQVDQLLFVISDDGNANGDGEDGQASGERKSGKQGSGSRGRAAPNTGTGTTAPAQAQP